MIIAKSAYMTRAFANIEISIFVVFPKIDCVNYVAVTWKFDILKAIEQRHVTLLCKQLTHNAAGEQRPEKIPNWQGLYVKPLSSRRLLHWLVKIQQCILSPNIPKYYGDWCKNKKQKKYY